MGLTTEDFQPLVEKLNDRYSGRTLSICYSLSKAELMLEHLRKGAFDDVEVDTVRGALQLLREGLGEAGKRQVSRS